jgi:hypothetical protein
MIPDFKLPKMPSIYETQSKHFMEAVRDVRIAMESKTKPDQAVTVSYSDGIEQISVGHVLVYTETAMGGWPTRRLSRQLTVLSWVAHPA